MKPLSEDLRRRIWEFHGSTGATIEETAEHFMVGTASVKRILAGLRKTGSLSPKPHGGGPPTKVPDDKLGVIRAIVEVNNDATRQDLCDRWFDRTGERLSVATMGRVLRRAGLTLKKKASGPAGASSPRSNSEGRTSPAKSPAGSSKKSSTSTSVA